jgi:hypothetical protein
MKARSVLIAISNENEDVQKPNSIVACDSVQSCQKRCDQADVKNFGFEFKAEIMNSFNILVQLFYPNQRTGKIVFGIFIQVGR